MIAPVAVLLATLAVASLAVSGPRGDPVRALWNLAGSPRCRRSASRRRGATALTLAGDPALFVLGNERRKKLFSIAIGGSPRALGPLSLPHAGQRRISVELDGSSACPARCSPRSTRIR